MLRQLHIRDFAIIEELQLEFAPGFNVLTGETGAGKSIIMQALDLVCGGRASPEDIRAGADEASIEGIFDLSQEESDLLAELGFAPAGDLHVRRILSRGGKSRVLTWPVATVFGFIARPDRHLFFKPRATRKAARLYGYALAYDTQPAWSRYQDLLTFAAVLRRDLDRKPGFKARDMIDLQSFMWVQGAPEYEP